MLPAAPYLQLLQQLHVLPLQLDVGLLQLLQPLRVLRQGPALHHLVLEDVVLHLVRVELLGDVHLRHLERGRGGRAGGEESRSEANVANGTRCFAAVVRWSAAMN